jgi:hypothetical protein
MWRSGGASRNLVLGLSDFVNCLPEFKQREWFQKHPIDAGRVIDREMTGHEDYRARQKLIFDGERKFPARYTGQPVLGDYHVNVACAKSSESVRRGRTDFDMMTILIEHRMNHTADERLVIDNQNIQGAHS